MKLTDHFEDIDVGFDLEDRSLTFTFQDKAEGTVEEITIKDSQRLLKFLEESERIRNKLVANPPDNATFNPKGFKPIKKEVTDFGG
jgi:hypothetical protein